MAIVEAADGLRIRIARDDDAEALARNIRGCDVREIAATSLAAPVDAIRRAIGASERTWVGELDGSLMFVAGITHRNFMSPKRSPWLLGTPLIEEKPRPFLRYTRGLMPSLRVAYPIMENHVDARSLTTISWLTWLGFTIHPAEPYGALRRPFHRFTLISEAGNDEAGKAEYLQFRTIH